MNQHITSKCKWLILVEYCRILTLSFTDVPVALFQEVTVHCPVTPYFSVVPRVVMMLASGTGGSQTSSSVL